MKPLQRETVEAYSLATVGAVEGVWKYCIKPELTARRAWLAMGLGILAYEMAAPPGELLSEGVDAALETHPYITTAAIGAVALHLMNALPERIDPLHRLTEALR